MGNFALIAGALVAAAVAGVNAGSLITTDEIGRRDSWVGSSFAKVASGGGFPFSFNYGDRKSSELLPKWERSEATRKLDEARSERTFAWKDPQTGLGYDSRRKDLDYALLRKLVAERELVVPNYYGDYYPLTGWSAEPDAWIGWQFDRPESGQGVVQAFRRPQSPYESARFRLRGLDPDATYAVNNLDESGATEIKGRELCENGLAVTIPDKPGAVIITYSRAGN